jgi:intracellular multiplication protein IcmE
VEELVAAEYPPKQLKELGLSCAQLRAAGASAGAVRLGGFSAKEMRSAGFSLSELRQGGVTWKECTISLRATYDELVDAGYDGEGLDPKNMLFKQYRPD